MPNNPTHSEHTFKRYGVYASDVHSWMDEPSTIIGGNHRRYRHTPDMEIPKMFIDSYGEELARNIILDHIYLDSLVEGKVEKELRGDEFFFPVELLFDECPYEYHSEEWWDWYRFREIENIIDNAVRNHIEWINKVHPDKKIHYYNKYPHEKLDLSYNEKCYFEWKTKMKIDEYFNFNNWETLWNW